MKCMIKETTLLGNWLKEQVMQTAFANQLANRIAYFIPLLHDRTPHYRVCSNGSGGSAVPVPVH